MQKKQNSSQINELVPVHISRTTRGFHCEAQLDNIVVLAQYDAHALTMQQQYMKKVKERW